jgi:hypothetical protein
MNSAIFVILSAILHCYSTHPFPPATVLINYATPLRHFATLLNHFFTVLDHFMILLAIFHYYSTQPFWTAIVLSYFSVLQYSVILSQCSVICDHVNHFRVARMRSGSREGTRLDCMWARSSIGYTRRTEPCGTEPRVRWSRARHGVARAWGVGSVTCLSRLVWVDRWVHWSITLGDK